MLFHKCINSQFHFKGYRTARLLRPRNVALPVPLISILIAHKIMEKLLKKII